ncbi:carbohydrate porin [Telmatobacter bradus]|uniref:carbohydrate porin n=1 Tax=Telmatobacter bradus TaxID=474953 RepID=UPI003B4339EF
MRTRLVERGIEPSAFLITDPYANVHGGQQTGASDYSLAGVDFHFKTEKLIGLRGGDFFVGGAVNFGNSLTDAYVGNSNPIQLADVAGTQPRLTYLGYEQRLDGDKLNLRVGRLTVNSLESEEFMGSEYFKIFASVGFNLIPQSLFFNANGAAGYPHTTWGARVRYHFDHGVYAAAGAYNGDPRQRQGYQHGIDMSVRGPLFTIGEVGWSQRGNTTNVKLGGYYNGGTYTKLAGTTEQNATGLYGLYTVVDHQLLSFGNAQGVHRHLGVVGTFTAEPQQRVNTVPWFFDGGFAAYGPFAARPHDIASVGVVYGNFKNAPASLSSTTEKILQRDNDEVVEASYTFALHPGLSFQPDLQYMIHPRGSESIASTLPTGSHVPNALALGANIVLNF